MSSVAEALGPLASRLDFAAFLDDHERLLKVTTALPALALLPEHLLMSPPDEYSPFPPVEYSPV